MSGPEELILNLLKDAKISFIREHKIKDLRTGLQRFDFYIPGRNIAIEYNGQQHYYQVKRFQKSQSEFRAQCEMDRYKISYCLAHGITLYCIPYWDLPYLKTAADLFKMEYIAKTKFHNDLAFQKFDKAK